MQMRSISAIIPVYNEEKYLNITFESINKILRENFEDFEIIFVDDGSSDNSAVFLEQFSKRNGYVKIIKNSNHEGLGAALNKGFRLAKNEIIFYTDCDLPYDLNFLLTAMPLIDEYDVILGKRDKWDNFLRKLTSILYNFMVSSLFHSKISDNNAGIKVFKRGIVETIHLNSRYSFIWAEFNLKALLNNFTIKELPCNYRRRIYGSSKSFNIVNIFLSFSEMLNYYFSQKDIFSAKKK